MCDVVLLLHELLCSCLHLAVLDNTLDLLQYRLCHKALFLNDGVILVVGVVCIAHLNDDVGC